MKKYITRPLFLLPAFFSIFLLSGCRQSQNRMYDGYYLAETEMYDSHGWKEYVSVFINNNRIVSVEYNATNQAGLVKSWDMEYMRVMARISGTYPNAYTRYYVTALLETQNPDRIDALTGATDSWVSFKLLSAAVLESARKGDKNIQYVKNPEQEEL